jgi:hypothetical protein
MLSQLKCDVRDIVLIIKKLRNMGSKSPNPKFQIPISKPGSRPGLQIVEWLHFLDLGIGCLYF